MSIRKAAAAVAVLFGLTVNVPVMAQDAASRPTPTPLKLNQFMKPQVKPAKRAGKIATASPRIKTAAPATGKRVASAAMKKHAAASKKKKVLLAKASSHSRPKVKREPVQTTGLSPQESPPSTSERGDRVRVMSFNEVNEIDLAADPVQVVEQDQLNDLDAAADANRASTPPGDPPRTDDGVIVTAPGPGEPANAGWLQRILMALGGVLATVTAIKVWVG